MKTIKKYICLMLLNCFICISLAGCGFSINELRGVIKDKKYDGRVSSEKAEEITNALMDDVLEALNDKDKDRFVSLFSEPVREANPQIEGMAEAVMELFHGKGEITDGSYYGEDVHSDHGTYSHFGSNLYTVETDVATYRICIGNYITDAFDRNMEGLFVFQIWEDGYFTGKLSLGHVGIKSDGGIYIYHCNRIEQLEELPHLILSDDKGIRVSDLPEERRNVTGFAKEDANVNLITDFPYIDYYDEIPISYNLEFDSNDGIHYIYRFDLETMELIDKESYRISHPQYTD